MTLREKFEPYAKKEVWERRNYNAEECEEIADEFAIEFSEWVLDRFTFKDFINKDPKKLLKTYKRQKGL